MTALLVVAGILGTLCFLPIVVMLWAVALTYAMKVGREAFRFRDEAALWQPASRAPRPEWTEETDASGAATAEPGEPAAPVRQPGMPGIPPAASWQMPTFVTTREEWQKFWNETKDQPTSVTETGGTSWDTDEREPIERIDEAPRAPGSKLAQAPPD